MKRILFSVALVAGSLFASSAHAVTCSDTGSVNYLTTCTSGTNGQACIVPTGILNGCCNKGTCNASGSCITGGPQDAACLNDNNPCTQDVCNQGAGYQPSCTHNAAPLVGTSCNVDNNVCTIDQCNSSGTCANVSTDTCAAQQASNPAGQCEVWQCNTSTGCHKDPKATGTVCDDGRDCTTGDACDANGNCSRGASGSFAPAGTPCRDDDTSGVDHRTWCKAGTCDGESQACKDVEEIEDGQPCDPNPCTNATCDGDGGDCIIDTCNVGSSVYCAPCGVTLNCTNDFAGGNANSYGACGCISTF